jgi:hypothetical protein
MGREVDADHMGNKNSMIKWQKKRKEQEKSDKYRQRWLALCWFHLLQTSIVSASNQFSISKSTMVNVQSSKKKKETASHKQPKTVANTNFY